MSSSHVRNLYKICITIIKPLLNPYIPGTSDLQIDWRLKFKCSHWAAPLRAWGIGGRRHWWPMHGFPIYDLGSNCRLDPSLSKKCQEIESWWIMCEVPANSDQLFFRPGSYVVNMAYDFLWFPAGKVSKLPRKLCRLWLSKVSGARAAQTCAGGGRKVEAREFSSGEGTMKDMQGHWKVIGSSAINCPSSLQGTHFRDTWKTHCSTLHFSKFLDWRHQQASSIKQLLLMMYSIECNDTM